ncbi:MAG: Histidine--tRNA ligase [Candidatus Thorarchaeota archaeon]|nr:MAG: Histidine--tRNA ligase [Candidatus Thorarchaeota archaeon]
MLVRLPAPVTGTISGDDTMSEMRTVRGMRDLMGSEMRVKDYLVQTVTDVFQLFGYESLDSPVMELWETLSAKGGEDVEAEVFKFTDKGDREVGMRFDLTVPLARIVSSNPHLPKPFKRYAIGKAWRYDRPQAGRYREFMQADVDVIGSDSPVADTEVVMVALEALRRLLGSDYQVRINSRKVLKGLTERAGVADDLAFDCFRAIDKLDKIGRNGVLDELEERGIDDSASDFLLDSITLRGSGRTILEDFMSVMEGSNVGAQGVQELMVMADIFDECEVANQIKFDLSLARGLDYYTGPVFEVAYLGEPEVGSIGGGGRYDHLIGKFGGPDTPATGISLGIDRLLDILLAKNIEEKMDSPISVFIAPIKQPMVKHGMKIMRSLVEVGIPCEIDLMDRPLGKLLSLSDDRGAQYTIIVGKRDLQKNEVSLRDMTTKETEQVDIDNIVTRMKSLLGK